jgi:mannose-6-phosphate isomerase-like protein (cupin superfamily)
MLTQTLEQSPKNRRDQRQTSHLLLARAQFGSRNLAITWVEGAPRSQQSLHAHPDTEQVYVIVAGRGHMIIDGEREEVRVGTMVFIPPRAEHAFRNPGPARLVYASRRRLNHQPRCSPISPPRTAETQADAAS